MTERIKSPRRRKVEQFFVRHVAQFFCWLARIVPLRTLQRVGNIGGLIIMATTPWRQKLADRNLKAVFGDKYDARARRRIRRLATTGIAKTMLELIKMRYMSEAEIRSVLTVEGLGYLHEALKAGHGGIILTAHYGNWELVNALCQFEGLPVSVVAKATPDASTSNMMTSSRESHGGHVIDRDDVREMLSVLRRGEFLGILPDQHAKHGGILGTFLGLPASLAPGPATFALRTKCPVIPCFSYRQPNDTFHCVIYPPLDLQDTGDREADVLANTQKIMDVIGEQIQQHPEQWLWLHDRWRPHDARVVGAHSEQPGNTQDAGKGEK